MRLHNRDVRQDVRELGALLGTVLEEQTSRRSFETVESSRQAAIEYRSGDRESRDPLVTELEGSRRINSGSSLARSRPISN